MNPKTQQVMHKPAASSSSEAVVSVNDLLIKILLCLPLKSLMRFKLVSKHWISLITSPYFSLHYSPKAAVGLFYPKLDNSTAFGYIHLDAKNTSAKPQRTELILPVDPYPVRIHHSCNGLLLCYSAVKGASHAADVHYCYVYNPTTNYSTKLPRPGVVNGVPKYVRGLHLAFDPTRSPPSHKVVCVRQSEISKDLSQIEIYSPESDHKWRVSGKPFASSAVFFKGVYWNGSIHWLHFADSVVLCFDVDQERLRKVPMPCLLGAQFGYFGESCGYLHLVLTYDDGDYLYAYEMKQDSSGWFVKYQVNLAAVRDAYNQHQKAYFDHAKAMCWVTRFFIFSIVRSENGDAAFLVLKFSRKVLKFDLLSNTFEEVYTLESDVIDAALAHQYIESVHMFPRGP